jgi:Glycosyltransferase family 87
LNGLARSWSAWSESRRVALVYAALAALALSLTLLHYGFYTHRLILDTIEYQRFGLAMLDGHVPYRDFRVEYPPAALPMFALPALGHPDFDLFQRQFQILIGLLAGGALLAMAYALGALRASPTRLAAALFFFALAPLVLGSVVIHRYDLWPAALTVGGIALVIGGRDRSGFLLLGIGIAAKLFPAVVVPPAVAYVWRTRGRREALIALGCAAAAVAVIVIPFLALAPHGFWESIHRQAERPLQIESLGSGILLAAHQLGAVDLHVVTSHGSQNLSGALPDALGLAQTVILAAVLIGIWIAAARGPQTPERLVRYSAASVVAFVAFDKVLSPQFMIWLIPLVPLVCGRRGLMASALLALALLLTQLWSPIRYWDLARDLDAFPSWLVLARDLVLVALLATLLLRERGPAAARS